MRIALFILGVMLMVVSGVLNADPKTAAEADLGLLPYPQEVTRHTGQLSLGVPKCITDNEMTDQEKIAYESLRKYLPKVGDETVIRIGSIEEGCDPSWITSAEKSFLAKESTSHEASVLHIERSGITVVGKGKIGMLYGVQTINQLAIQAARNKRDYLPLLTIRDWPDMKWRCLSPTITWYSGYNRLEGYDLCNWTEDEWKWLVDWSLLHKCNAWAMCMYGYWPFTLPGYESNTLDVDSFRFNLKTGKKEAYRFTHKNIQKKFYSDVIKYANERGVEVHAYIGKNSFNGTFWLSNPEMNGGGAAELLPFAPGVREYWNAMIKRILEIGFNGFVFEDPEAYHVPNQNAQCYSTFWEPWAEKYGYKSIADTDQNNPPLGVHVEYYSWLFKEFDTMIASAAKSLGRKEEVDIYLISHILLSRIIGESKTPEERDNWLKMADEKQGRKVPFIISESDEKKYVDIFGGDRVASLGGRGGSCTCAMRRIASINNDWSYGPMGASVDYERDCQKHIYQAGGFGAMGYIFEWTNTEVYAYIAAQHLWRNSGVPGINNEDQVGFLDYAYRMYYGDKAGAAAAKAHDASSCVNDAMILEGVAGSQYPSTGQLLERDFQYLAAQSDRAWDLAVKAYKLYTGKTPNLEKPVYDQDDFKWTGYDIKSDKLFKTERLRLLCVSARRTQLMCEAALANRLSQRLISEGAGIGSVLKQMDLAVKAAKENQRVYQINYDDDYDWTDGLCYKITERLQTARDQFLMDCKGSAKEIHSWVFNKPGDQQGWTWFNDAALKVSDDGSLEVTATGVGPCFSQEQPFKIDTGSRTFVEIKLTSDKAGRGRVFWAAPPKDDAAAKMYPFSEARVSSFEIHEGGEYQVYRVFPSWSGPVSGLRIDTPAGSKVKINSIRILEIPEIDESSLPDINKPTPDVAKKMTAKTLSIPWEKMSDIIPYQRTATKPGRYLSVDLGLDQKKDYFRVGVAFTVQAEVDGKWQPIFRTSLDRRDIDWDHWDIPLNGVMHGDQIKLRLISDSYSRAQDRSAPSWKWAVWGNPQIVEVNSNGARKTLYNLADQASSATKMIQLDSDGKLQGFDNGNEDSSGAVFRATTPSPLDRIRQNEGKDWQWVEGFSGWDSTPAHYSPYRCYIGIPQSGWVYGHEKIDLSWATAPVKEKKDTAFVFIGGTDYNLGPADLICNGKKLLSFELGSRDDAKWEKDGVELRFLFGGDTRDERTTFGLSGVFILRIPAAMITPGQPLHLLVRPSADSGWFMIHEFNNAMEATRDTVTPEPVIPSIAAFTPHLNGRFGVTIGEYEISLKK
ncbi:MAG: glycoside hydrolase family 20 zincin-like fold domain-containing protein [Armatimonadota bacterium]